MANKEKNTTIVRVPYGISHTRRYQPSILSELLIQRSSGGEILFISDVNLLLRQKTLHRQIGVDLLREYVQSLEKNQIQQHNFSDEELFKLIDPKGVNNLTTSYEFAQYIKNNSDKMKERYDTLKKNKESYLDLLNKINNK